MGSLSVTHHAFVPILAQVPSLDSVLVGGWQFRKPITLGLALHPVSKFVGYFHVIDPRLATVANGGVVQSPTGLDITFAMTQANPTGGNTVTPLRFDRRYYNPVTGEFAAWILFPMVPGLSDYVPLMVHIYYGNTNVTTDWQSKAATWNDDWQSVLNGDTLTAYGQTLLADASGFRRHGVPSFTPAFTTGPLVGLPGIIFDNHPTGGQNVRLTSPPMRDAYSVSFWFQENGQFGSSVSHVYDHERLEDSQGLEVTLRQVGAGGGQLTALAQNPAASPTGVVQDTNPALDDGDWHQAIVTWDGSTGMQLFVDGAPVSTSAFDNDAEPGTFAYWGGFLPDLSTYFTGNLAGMRVAARTLSLDYVDLEWRANTGTLYTIGAESSLPLITFTIQQLVGSQIVAEQLPLVGMTLDYNAYLWPATAYSAAVVAPINLGTCWVVGSDGRYYATGACFQEAGFDAHSQWFPSSPFIGVYQDQNSINVDQNLSGFMTVRVWSPLTSLPEDHVPVDPTATYFLEALPDLYTSVMGFSQNIVYSGADEQFQTWIYRGIADIFGNLQPFPVSHP